MSDAWVTAIVGIVSLGITFIAGYWMGKDHSTSVVTFVEQRDRGRLRETWQMVDDPQWYEVMSEFTRTTDDHGSRMVITYEMNYLERMRVRLDDAQDDDADRVGGRGGGEATASGQDGATGIRGYGLIVPGFRPGVDGARPPGGEGGGVSPGLLPHPDAVHDPAGVPRRRSRRQLPPAGALALGAWRDMLDAVKNHRRFWL